MVFAGPARRDQWPDRRGDGTGTPWCRSEKIDFTPLASPHARSATTDRARAASFGALPQCHSERLRYAIASRRGSVPARATAHRQGTRAFFRPASEVLVRSDLKRHPATSVSGRSPPAGVSVVPFAVRGLNTRSSQLPPGVRCSSAAAAWPRRRLHGWRQLFRKQRRRRYRPNRRHAERSCR